MNGYKPTLDDVEKLVAQNPSFFDSPLQTQRSIDAARRGLWTTQDATANAHYQQYLRNGGTPIGPSGQMPARGDTLDQRFGAAACDCAAAAPCCLRALVFQCSHGSNRMTLPLADPSKPRTIVVVADQAPNPGHDQMTVTPTRRPGPTCSMPARTPIFRLDGQNISDHPLSGAVPLNLHYTGPSSAGGTDIEKFIFATKNVLFGSIDALERYWDFRVLSCSRTGAFDGKILIYPKLEWKATAFYYEVTGTFFSNMTFVPELKMGGKLEGVYGASSWAIEADGSSKPDPQQHTKSIIPFIDGALRSMVSATSGGASDPATNTRSSIQIAHKVELGNSTFKLAEHPSDHSKLGIEGEVQLQFAPLFGITAELDLIDALLTAAQGVAPGLATAIIKARERMARGVGNPDGPMHASAHIAVKLAIAGNIGNGGVTISRKVGDSKWQGSGSVGGDTGVTVTGLIRVEGKAYAVAGAAAAEANAQTKLKVDLKTLTQSAQAEANGAKFNVKVEWEGISVSYNASVRASAFGVSMRPKRDSGKIVICEPEVLYESNF
jgi:hypothetical protein